MTALPREVFFEVMRNSFRITYKEVCDAILSEEPIGGLSAKERGRDAARRNREFIHVGPGTDDACWQLTSPDSYTNDLLDRIIRIVGEQEGIATIIDVLSGDGADALRTSLDACGLDGSAYSNLVTLIMDGEQSDSTTAYLLLRLFVGTAISGRPAESAQEVINTAKRIENDTMVTGTPPIQDCEVQLPCDESRYALTRCVGKVLYPSRTYLISPDSDGTHIGSIAYTPNYITDVERGVSRNHLHIWCDDDGQLWCKGMLSRNGTVKYDRTTGQRIVIEPPCDERPDDYEPQAYPLNLADSLILAGNTEFIVIAINA